MKLKKTATGEVFSSFKLYGWRYCRLELARMYFGAGGGELHFNRFVGVKLGFLKFWVGWHTRFPNSVN